MKLYAFVFERGKVNQFRKEEFLANKINDVYYLEGATPKWLCRHYVYSFEINRAVSIVADFVFLLEDDEERAKLIMDKYYLKEIEELQERIEEYNRRREKVANGTISNADTK